MDITSGIFISCSEVEFFFSVSPFKWWIKNYLTNNSFQNLSINTGGDTEQKPTNPIAFTPFDDIGFWGHWISWSDQNYV